MAARNQPNPDVPGETPYDDSDANRDPITGAPGSHPIGTGTGAAIGGLTGAGAAAAAGAAAGAVIGPLGVVAGAAIGGLVGGLAGHQIAEGINPTEEHEYWRKNYLHRPYAEEGGRAQELPYETFAPAYQYGWESYSRHGLGEGERRSFDDLEPQLGQDWETHRGDQDLSWTEARPATRDAWNRVSDRRVAEEGLNDAKRKPR